MSAIVRTSISQYLSNIKDSAPLTKEEFYELHAKFLNGDMSAKEKMIRHNLRLVVSIANRYAHSEEALLELIQEGNVGLIKAVEKFETSRGLAFSTFAVAWIKERILYFLNTNSKIANVPMDMMKLSRKIKKMQDGDPSLDTEKIAKLLNKSVRKIAAAQKINESDISFDATYGSSEDDASGLSNMLSESVDASSEAESESTQKWLRMQVSKLPEKQRMAITFAFGLDNTDPLNGEEIGKRINLTRERARQLLIAGKNALAQAAIRDGMNAQNML